jgi:hypothetical protein
VSCGLGCDRCNSTACLSCLSEGGLLLVSGSCSLCSTLIPHCLKCSNSTLCTNCVSGYYWSSNQCQ